MTPFEKSESCVLVSVPLGILCTDSSPIVPAFPLGASPAPPPRVTVSIIKPVESFRFIVILLFILPSPTTLPKTKKSPASELVNEPVPEVI